jgi:hypothetical protein
MAPSFTPKMLAHRRHGGPDVPVGTASANPPGAVWPSTRHLARSLFDDAGFIRSETEIAARYRGAGVDLGDELLVYCGRRHLRHRQPRYIPAERGCRRVGPARRRQSPLCVTARSKSATSRLIDAASPAEVPKT